MAAGCAVTTPDSRLSEVRVAYCAKSGLSPRPEISRSVGSYRLSSVGMLPVVRRIFRRRLDQGWDMSTVTENGQDTSTVEMLPFRDAGYVLQTASGTAAETKATWKVVVRSDGHMIVRDVSYDAEPWDPTRAGWEPEGVIWPTWPVRSEDEAVLAASPLAEVQEYWSTVGNRLRDSAKWMAAVLGAALATVVGASPVAGLRADHLQGIAIGLGLGGLAFLGLTMFLVLQVMRPQSVSFTDVQSASQGHWPWRPALDAWRDVVESQEDLYLPCGVPDLTSLRQSMIIEEVTLQALARARGSARDPDASSMLAQAQTARAARLLELRTAGARIATVGEYYRLRARSTRATYIGIICGLAGTAAIVAAFAWPLH